MTDAGNSDAGWALAERVIETLREPLVLLDAEMRVVRVNLGFLRHFGLAPGEVRGRLIHDLPRVRWNQEQLAFLIENLLPRQAEVRDFEIEVEIPAAGPRALIVNARRIPASDGRGGHVLLAIGDASAGEERFRLLVEGVKDFAVFMLGAEGEITSWNAGAERILGYRKEEVAGRSFSLIFPPDAIREGEPENALRLAFAEGTFETEGWRVRKDGTRFLAHILLTALRDEEGKLKGFSLVTRDVTERRHLEDQLRQSQKMEAVGRLAGGIAHDFNNLLTVILGYSRMLGGRLGGREPDGGQVAEILAAGERAADLTRQLLAFSRRQAFQPKVLNLNSVIEGACAILRRVIGEDIELVRLLAPDLGSVRADPGQLEQILMNLAVNARDAMPRGGRLTIETANVDLDEEFARTHVGTVQGAHVMLALSDTGGGMTPEVLSHLFEPFFTTKPPGKGTGLGLSTVYGIVKQSRGSIWVQSAPSRGSTFRIYLPTVAEVPEPHKPREAPMTSPRGQETVLVVEDDEPVRLLVGQFLEGEGYRVFTAGHPDKSIRVLEAEEDPIHLLLTDIVMPGMSGLDLSARALAFRPDLRVLYISGHTSASIIDRLSAGSWLLLKPFDRDALLRKVREVLEAPGGR